MWSHSSSTANPLEVFLCTTAEKNSLRQKMCELVEARWKAQPDIQLTVLGGHGKEFQRERRILAETQSKNDTFILADDDCLPLPFSAGELVGTAERYPIFGQLSFSILNATIYPWTPEQYAVFENHDVQEHVSVGGIRYCKKGAMMHWPEQDEMPGYDRIQADVMRDNGLRVGYLRNFKCTHLGEGFSTVWKV